MRKLFICYLFFGCLLNADEMDNMLQLESLFNLDVEAETAIHSTLQIPDIAMIEVVVDKNNSSIPAEVVVVADGGEPVSQSDLAFELAAAHKEIARLKDIVNRILIANRNERSEMYYNMGCIFRYGKDTVKAEQAFLKSLEINPDDPAVYYNLGILYDDDLNIPQKAIKYYKRFLELSPEDKDAGKVYEWVTALE